jgi:hypothetical protein
MYMNNPTFIANTPSTLPTHITTARTAAVPNNKLAKDSCVERRPSLFAVALAVALELLVALPLLAVPSTPP